MKPASADMLAYIASARASVGVQPNIVEVYTAIIPGMDPMRWVLSNARIVVGGLVYDPGPILDRGPIRTAIGLDVGGVDVTLSGRWIMPDGRTLFQAATNGVLDYARFKIEQVVMPQPGDVSLGTIYLYEGQAAEVVPSMATVRVTLRSEIEVLKSTQIPRRVYQPSCPWALFDAACGLDESAHRVSATVASGSTVSVIRTSRTEANDYFNLGYVTFLTGALAGVRRAVSDYAQTNGAITMAMPLPAVPAVGDTLTVTPGCDKTWATCDTRYSNSLHYGGFPFLPQAQDAENPGYT